jgi:hypothetical protein
VNGSARTRIVRQQDFTPCVPSHTSIVRRSGSMKGSPCSTRRSLPPEPMVRIRLPPAASQVRTCLSREFAFLCREAAVFRGCAGRGERLTKPSSCEACSAFTRVAACTLARSPYFVTRYPKASDISSPPCLLRLLPAGANRRVGLAPTGKRRLFTAHTLSRHCLGHGEARKGASLEWRSAPV